MDYTVGSECKNIEKQVLSISLNNSHNIQVWTYLTREYYDRENYWPGKIAEFWIFPKISEKTPYYHDHNNPE